MHLRLFRGQLLLMVHGVQTQTTHKASQRNDRMDGHKTRLRQQVPTHIFHGRRPSVQEKPLPRIHSRFRRQTGRQIPLVPLFIQVGKQTAVVDLPRLAINMRIDCRQRETIKNTSNYNNLSPLSLYTKWKEFD